MRQAYYLTIVLVFLPMLVSQGACTPQRERRANPGRSPTPNNTGHHADRAPLPDRRVAPPSPSKDAGKSAGRGPTSLVHPVKPGLRYSLSTTGLPSQGRWKSDPVFADVNEDGFLDLVAHPRLGAQTYVWLGNGEGSWRESSSGLNVGVRTCGGGLEVADVNGDHHLDLAVADHCKGVFVFLGDGEGHWESVATEIPLSLATEHMDLYAGAEDLALGDVNGDGLVDLVASGSDEGGITLFLGDGTGKNWTRTPSSLPNSGWALRVILTDINADGMLDLAAAYSEGPRVWLGDGKGGFKLASQGLPTPMFQGLYMSIAAGDVNEDGRIDLLTANWVDGPEVYIQQQDGSWNKSPDACPEMLGGAFGLALGDVDGDRHLDMVISGRLSQDVGYVYGVFLLRGDGRGGWSRSEGIGLPESGLPFTFGVGLGDINHDGILDIAAGSGGHVAKVTGQTPPSTPTLLVWTGKRVNQ